MGAPGLLCDELFLAQLETTSKLGVFICINAFLLGPIEEVRGIIAIPIIAQVLDNLFGGACIIR